MTKKRLYLCILSLSVFIISVNRVFAEKEVKILKEWRGKSVLSGFYVIKNIEDIPEGFPEIKADFGKEMLIAAFLGLYQSGSPSVKQSIDIMKIREDKQLVVYIHSVAATIFYKVWFSKPQPEVYHIVSISKSEKPVTIYNNDKKIIENIVGTRLSVKWRE